MVTQNQSKKRGNPGALPLTAALLAVVAGGTLAVAQQNTPPQAPPAGAVEGAFWGPAQNQAGPGDEQPELRDPMDLSATPGNGQVVRVDPNNLVDLHVNDEDLRTVLQMLSIQSQKNIVASRNVSAKVTADLYGVTFYEALDAILHINGYGYEERGNFIFVRTIEELEAIEKANRQRVSKVVKLNYLNAVDAADFVKELLSEEGSIKTNGKSGSFPSPNNPIGADEFAAVATMVIVDYPENVAEIEKLLTELDTRPSQVLVEATILQADLTEENAFGVDFALIGDLEFNDFVGWGGPTRAVDAIIGNRTTPTGTTPLPTPDNLRRGVVSSPGNTAGKGTLKVGVTGSELAVFLKLLDEVTDSTIMSNPKILTLNRMPGRVLVGTKVGYLSTTSNDTTTTQTVEFLDTGTQLAFRPFVSNDGFIRMELKPQVSEAVIREVSNTTGAVVTIPDEVTNELTTNVMVRDGQTVVLGGLFRESNETARRQVPFLGDIPILGAAFRGHDTDYKRREIIFLITPSVVSDQVLAAQGEEGEKSVARARAGLREGLLPFSRERMTSQRLMQAERLAAEGQNELAIKKLRDSLRLSKNQPEARALLESLGDSGRDWPARSMLEQVVNEKNTSPRALKSVAPASLSTGMGVSAAAIDASDPRKPESVKLIVEAVRFEEQRRQARAAHPGPYFTELTGPAGQPSGPFFKSAPSWKSGAPSAEPFQPWSEPGADPAEPGGNK
jgi:type IV pilus secretin PilQ/predicted competence protein